MYRQHVRSLSEHFHARRTPPSFPRKRESSASAWIPGLRFTPPGMTGERWLFLFFTLPGSRAWLASCGFRPPFWGQAPDCLQAAYPIPVSTFPRLSNPPPVIPAKAGIQCLGVDSGSPFHSARNDGGEAVVSFFPLCQLCGHGWRPASFGPLPRGRVPFCQQQQKGTKKCRPLIPLFPALLGPAGGWPTRPFTRPTQTCPFRPDPVGPAMLRRDEGGNWYARRFPKYHL